MQICKMATKWFNSLDTNSKFYPFISGYFSKNQPTVCRRNARNAAMQQQGWLLRLWSGVLSLGKSFDVSHWVSQEFQRRVQAQARYKWFSRIFSMLSEFIMKQEYCTVNSYNSRILLLPTQWIISFLFYNFTNSST